MNPIEFLAPTKGKVLVFILLSALALVIFKNLLFSSSIIDWPVCTPASSSDNLRLCDTNQRLQHLAYNPVTYLIIYIYSTILVALIRTIRDGFITKVPIKD